MGLGHARILLHGPAGNRRFARPLVPKWLTGCHYPTSQLTLLVLAVGWALAVPGVTGSRREQ